MNPYFKRAIEVVKYALVATILTMATIGMF